MIESVVHFDSRRVKLAKLVKENDQRKAGESRLESVCTHSTVGYDPCDHCDPTLHKRTLHQDTVDIPRSNNRVIKIPHWELIDTEVSRRFKKSGSKPGGEACTNSGTKQSQLYYQFRRYDHIDRLRL